MRVCVFVSVCVCVCGFRQYWCCLDGQYYTLFCECHTTIMSDHVHYEQTHCNTTHTHCNTLQHTATHCNTLQHTATHCNTLQHIATDYNMLQHTATHCNTLQYTPAHYTAPTLDLVYDVQTHAQSKAACVQRKKHRFVVHIPTDLWSHTHRVKWRVYREKKTMFYYTFLQTYDFGEKDRQSVYTYVYMCV